MQTVLSVSSRLPEPYEINEGLGIQWSGRFALDAVFVKLQGKSYPVFLLSDFNSLDVIDYHIALKENYYSWKAFLLKAVKRNNIKTVIKFFVSDGKKGLHQALSELFPDTPVQVCISHKLRRIHQIIPHIRGDGYDKLFARLAQLSINAPIKEMADSYLNILVAFRYSTEYNSWPEDRQNKLNKIIGALRFQKSKLQTRYSYPELICDDITTNHLEGINGFLKERLKLMRGIKNPDNFYLYIKLLIHYYRFHKFTSSRFKARNGCSPISLNGMENSKGLNRINKGNQPYSWIKNLLPCP
ncbi:transposase [Patescibacteria group bacterium]|nr:transposase [Patescibacteria group bacterium]MBU4512177.1 transposase [Patescibacteria group bacterium]MCG2692743.1 transposase [Candidatus Parcubacteria bacterium]